MNKILLSLLFFFLFALPAATAQELCGFDLVHQRRLEKDPEYRKTTEAFEQLWQAYQSRQGKFNVNGSDTVYEIPVVIHVMHTGGAINTSYNPADTQLVNWITYLNQVFSATYAPYPDTANGGKRIPMKFVLAKRDTSCNATTGIVRVNASSLAGYTANGLNSANSNGVDDNVLAALSRWNPNVYYNIYVVNKIDGEDGISPSGPYTTGFAYFAGGSASVDGAYMLARVAKQGQSTLPHEIGHAMGLFHTFEGGSETVCPPNSNCSGTGDRVCDTEPVKNLLSVSPCATNSQTNSCTGINYNSGQNNIMGYGSCLNRFTAGQSDRAMLQLKTYRGGQMSSIGSLAVTLPVKPSPCTPAIVNATNTFGMGPCNVTLNTIRYTSNGYNIDGNRVYIDNSCQLQTVIKPSVSSTLSVTTTTNPQKVVVYIDYNNNGTFEVAERIMNHTGTIAAETHSVTFTPAAGAVQDTPLRMRVIADWASSATPTSCTTLDYGQTEDFAVFISNSNPLPVKLIKFDAFADQKQKLISLSWQTAMENGSDRFILERSTDGEHYAPVSEISTTGKPSSYTFKDAQVELLTAYYYRLKWINKDGSTEYSMVVTAKLDRAEPSLKLFPNPVTKNEVHYAIGAPANGAEIMITDLTGKTVLKMQVKQQEGSIDLHRLNNGIYFISISADGKEKEKQKLVLQR